MSQRVESFRYELLNLDDEIIDILRVDPGGSVEESVAKDVRIEASINVVNQDIDWETHRVRITYVWHGGSPDGADLEVPVLTGIAAIPEIGHSSVGTSQSLKLQSKLVIPLRDKFAGTYGVDAGISIMDTVHSILLSCGFLPGELLLHESDKTTNSAQFFEPADTKLKIVNALLEQAGAFALWVDGLGYIRSTPYTEPASRPDSFVLADDGQHGYLPDWVFKKNVDGLPNVFTCISKGTEEIPGLVAEAVDLADIDRRGRRVPAEGSPATNVEAADLAALQLIAKRKLAEARQASTVIDGVKHPWRPGMELNNCGIFTHRSLATPIRCVLQQRRWSLRAGGLIESTMRGLI